MSRGAIKFNRVSVAIRRRILLVATLILLLVSLIIVQLFQIQIVNADKLSSQVENVRTGSQEIFAVRGDIVDDKGNKLAFTDLRYDAQIDPSIAKQFNRFTEDGTEETISVQQAYQEIAQITGQTLEEINARVNANPKTNNLLIKKELSLQQYNSLVKLGIPWMTLSANQTRVYPSGAVGGNIVGYVSDMYNPSAGIEVSQNKCLVESNGNKIYQKSVDGVAIPGSQKIEKEAQNGGTVHLTMNTDLQWQTQQIVDKQVAETGAEWAMTVVMEVGTGELKAVAENNTFDPNNYKNVPPEKLVSRAFLAPYEPGSTFKTITAANVIEANLANAQSQMVVPYSFNANGAEFKDATPHGTVTYSLTDIMVQSSNVGISKFGEKIPAGTRYEYLKKLGVAEPTNTGMGAESEGIMLPVEDWDSQTNYTTMFGQGVSSTIIQTAQIYQTFANKGVFVPAKIVSGCTNNEGKFIPFNPGESRQVYSERTAAEITSILENVPNASWLVSKTAIPGYRLAGKTGTAQQPDSNGGYRPDYVYSFAGYFPVENPKYVVVYSLAFPKVPANSSIASSGFKNVSQAVIKTFDVPPSG